MVINQDSLIKILDSMKTLTKEEMTLDECKKKIIGREVNITIEQDRINLFEASLLASFFIKYVDLEFDNKWIGETGKAFDRDLIFQIYRVNNSTYELVDVNNSKIRIPKNEIKITVRNAPLDVFLGFVQ